MIRWFGMTGFECEGYDHNSKCTKGFLDAKGYPRGMGAYNGFRFGNVLISNHVGYLPGVLVSRITE